MVRTSAARGALIPIAVGLIVVTAAISGTLIYRSGSAPPASQVLPGDRAGTTPPGASPSPSPPSDEGRRGRPGTLAGGSGAVTEADGALPDGVTVFDDEYPGVANLDSDLREALRKAATDAAHDGVELYITSGWRSAKYQEKLLDEAISKYGSKENAARWVGTPTTSAHVSGNAVDIGRSDGAAWLARHGATYGLCQIYRNEPWHYELRAALAEFGEGLIDVIHREHDA